MPGYLLTIIVLLLVGGFVTYAILSTKKALVLNEKTWLMIFWDKPSTKAIAASLISIFAGLIIGSLLLFMVFIVSQQTSFKACIDGIQLLFFGPFNTGRNSTYALMFGFNGVYIGDVLFNAMPLLLTGLSVALAFKTGLFNIGTPGQYLMGTTVTFIIALSIPTSVVPSFFVWLLAFIGGIVAGALWGAIPGFFKAYLNVNEVITCIMTNWIAANLVTAIFDKTNGLFKHLLDPSATKNLAYLFKTSHNNVSTSKFGLDLIFKGSQVNGGILVAILIAVVVYIVLNKTTFGFELKACGSNRHASKYAGINEKRNIILSMAIAGGLSAAGASLYYLSGNTEFAWETYSTLPSVAFNGIPVALLGSNNPIGVIFAAIFMSYLDKSGMVIKYMTTYNEYITSIISSVIVYFSAFSLYIGLILNGKIKLKKKHKKEDIETVEPCKEEIIYEKSFENNDDSNNNEEEGSK